MNKTAHLLEINSPTIELYKVLKLQGLSSSGGEAKLVIANGLVCVNGEIETRKRKKIVNGDIIDFSGEKITVQYVEK